MMPWGLGTDLVEISRIEQAIRRNPRFAERLFRDSELADYRDRGSRIEILAGKFAAKEAVVKALGTGVRGFSWTDIEILPDALGKPICQFYGKATTLADTLGVATVFLSIAHNRSLATASAMIFIKEEPHETGY